MHSSLRQGPAPAAPDLPAATPGHAGLRACLTVLSSAGCGLVLWVALSSALLLGRGPVPQLVQLQAWGLGLGVALAATGLGLFRPRPTGSARWWIRGLAALLVVIASGTTLALLQRLPAPDPGVAGLMAALACCGALAAVTARVRLDGDDTGRRLPAALALMLLAGAVVLFALIALRWSGPLPATGPLPSLALLALVAAALLVAQWHPQGGLRPWTRWRGRWSVLGLLAALPLLLATTLYMQPGWAGVIWPLVALSVLAGSVLERLQAR